jgi:hypothetical protein
VAGVLVVVCVRVTCWDACPRAVVLVTVVLVAGFRMMSDK